jgi:hypothetical protein
MESRECKGRREGRLGQVSFPEEEALFFLPLPRPQISRVNKNPSPGVLKAINKSVTYWRGGWLILYAKIGVVTSFIDIAFNSFRKGTR